MSDDGDREQPTGTSAILAKLVPWVKSVAAESEKTPDEDEPKRVAPWSYKKPAEAAPPAAEDQPASGTRKPVAPWSRGPNSPAPTKAEPQARKTTGEAIKPVAPWSARTSAPPSQPEPLKSTRETAKPPAPWSKSTASATPAPEKPRRSTRETVAPSTQEAEQSQPKKRKTGEARKPTVEQPRITTDVDVQALRPGHARIELDENGQVYRLEYPDGVSRTFQYDDESSVNQFIDARGRVTARNEDYSWTITDARGRRLGVEDRAYLTVSRDGNMVWGYFRDGSIVIQRTDCSAIKTDKSGELLSYVSPSGRRFSVDEAGEATYRVGDEDTLESLAEDVLRLQNWELAHYVPTRNQISRVSSTILGDNNLDALEPGRKIFVQVNLL